MAKQASIELKNLTKEYVTHEGTGTFLAVDHINVNIGSGEFVTLLGPSGCGKTTTLRMIAGFESVSGGDILLDGIRINEMTPDKRDSSMVFQSYALFPHYDVYDNVAYGLVNKKMDKKTIREKVMQMVELVGLKGLEYRMPNQLSGGQQQRVALARALVMEPAVLLFDEPLSNLDAKLRVYMRKEIRKIQQRIGITSVYVTHDQAEAMSLSDKIIIMNKGHIEQVGTPHEVYQHPASRFVADFIGSANFVEAKVSEGDSEGDSEGEMIPVRMLNEDFNVHYAGLPVKAGDTVQIVLRPEAIRLADSGDVEAEVISSTYMGAVQEYVVRAGDKELETEEYNPEGKRIYRPGDKVWLRIQRDALHAVEN
ncbi:ABC transporter ATP-binding protein [Dialister invisus]|uniref:ABC transporter ATP-binding protein n=1 Tax=Dialister invisus TaxID=218538 RepID=UPI0030798C9D